MDTKVVRIKLSNIRHYQKKNYHKFRFCFHFFSEKCKKHSLIHLTMNCCWNDGKMLLNFYKDSYLIFCDYEFLFKPHPGAFFIFHSKSRHPRNHGMQTETGKRIYLYGARLFKKTYQLNDTFSLFSIENVTIFHPFISTPP